MVCPMKFNLMGKERNGGCVSIRDCVCDKEKCAWWIKNGIGNLNNETEDAPEIGCCAIKLIAKKGGK